MLGNEKKKKNTHKTQKQSSKSKTTTPVNTAHQAARYVTLREPGETCNRHMGKRGHYDT